MEAPTSTTTALADSDLKGTTADQKRTTAVKNGTTTADQTGTAADFRRDHQQQYLRSLHERGGFVLSCKTVVTLHRAQVGTGKKEEKKEEGEGEEGKGWEMMGGGILSIVSKQDNLTLVFSHPESGEVTTEFKLGVSTCSYASLTNHFHSFVAAANGDDEEKKTVHGMSFADVDVATKVFRIIRRLSTRDRVGGATAVAGGNDNAAPSATKRVKLDEQDKYSEWVVINCEDVPEPSDANEAAEEGSVETDGTEETDFSIFSKKKDHKNDFKIGAISGPSYFRHITKTSDEPGSAQNPAPSSTGEVASGSEEVQKRTGTFERGTKRSSSFMEFATLEEQPLVPIPVSPPIAPSHSFVSSSSGDLTTSSSFASSFSGSSLELLPPPPPHDSSHESLVYQITTFNRRNLHHVTAEEMAPGGMGERESGLGSILRGGFDRMILKLRDKFGDVAFASLTSEGEEVGFDDFDGTLFE